MMRGINLATTYSHRTYRPTTIGAAAFHFRVRDGTGWFHCAVVTRGEVLRVEVEPRTLGTSSVRVAFVCLFKRRLQEGGEGFSLSAFIPVAALWHPYGGNMIE